MKKGFIRVNLNSGKVEFDQSPVPIKDYPFEYYTVRTKEGVLCTYSGIGTHYEAVAEDLVRRLRLSRQSLLETWDCDPITPVVLQDEYWALGRRGSVEDIKDRLLWATTRIGQLCRSGGGNLYFEADYKQFPSHHYYSGAAPVLNLTLHTSMARNPWVKIFEKEVKHMGRLGLIW